MGAIYTIQPTFTGGEIAPGLQGRVDLQKYATGVNKCLNGIIHPQGGVSNRSGFRYIARPKYANKRCRLVGFEFSATQAYMIEIGDRYARFYFNSGQIAVTSAGGWVTTTVYPVGTYVDFGGTIYYCIVAHTGGVFATDLAAGNWVAQVIYEVPLPYLEADLSELKFTQSVDVLYITHPDYPPKTFTRHGHTDWRLADFAFIRGPFMPENISATTLASTVLYPGTSGTLIASTNFFTADHVGSIWEIEHDFPSQTLSGAFTSNTSSTVLVGMGAWRLITHGTWAGKITVEKSLNGGSSWVEVRVFTSSSDFNPNTFGTDDNDGAAAIYRVTMSGYVSGTCNYDLTLDASTVRGIVKATAYLGPTNLSVTVVQQVGATSAVTSWSEGSWSNERGWPATVAFMEDRLAFGRTPAEPQTVWFSKTGEYINFGVSDPLVDSDSISVSLPSRKLNGVETIVPLGQLLVLTRSSEWSIGGSNGEPISPTTINTKSHGFRGTNGIDVCVIGNRAVYVQPQGTVVRDIGFEFSSDSYTGDDISLISSHLFAGYEITELCYQQEPDSLIWAIRSDGQMLSATYVREQQVLAWSHHRTDGIFESVATIPGDGFDQLWVVVKRGADRFVELQSERMASDAPEDQFFVDCGITYDDVPANVITGLDHLEGRAVSILADGIVVPRQVVTSGQITLATDASIVHVGLLYGFAVETLRLEREQRDGTLMGRKSRVSHVNVRVLNTRGGTLGPNSDELYDIEPELKKLLTIEDPKALASGDIKHTIASDWDNGGRVFFLQNKPLPATILAFMPVLTVGG